jgi:phosphocarrier protein
MQTFKYIITDKIGIHARPAGVLAKTAKNFESTITISSNGKTADATKLMAVMSLGIKNGDEITVTVNGKDETEATKKIEEFLKSNL